MNNIGDKIKGSKENESKREIHYFTKLSRDNTYKVVKYVDDYLAQGICDKIIISSTTGFTAECFHDVIKKYKVPAIICKQDLNEKLFMTEQTEKKISKYASVYDIPRGYLRGLIGLEATNMFRSFSQGYKVCTELVTFLLRNGAIEVGDKILVIAGTVVGADTAVEMKIKANGRFKVTEILSMAIN